MEINMKNFEAAMEAALRGPERKTLRIGRHEFNVKPVAIQRVDGVTIVDGGKGHHISHHKSMAPDDQVTFGFKRLADGTVIADEPKFTNGWIEFAKQVAEYATKAVAAAGALGLLKADGGIDPAAFEASKRWLDGTWQGEARFLIENIQLRVP